MLLMLPLSAQHLVVTKGSVDCGNVAYEKPVTAVFELKNKHRHKLKISKVETSCGCTKVEYSKQPVPPGETLELKVIYEAEDAGYFNKTVTVYCNVENSPLRLKVRGSAE